MALFEKSTVPELQLFLMKSIEKYLFKMQNQKQLKFDDLRLENTFFFLSVYTGCKRIEAFSKVNVNLNISSRRDAF